ncbi:DUF4391 domain-containing protein [Thalassospira sp. MIT1370]|uniref:DUF4391 domain-containing protein n=1 Tax=Thalassospira sp. MIT1370 TaxID=3093720 RepID=UPI003999BF2E
MTSQGSDLFDYPKQAGFNRVVPKWKIYEHAKANAALKEKFVQEVDKIIWAYKLAPETIKLDATKSVPEIQVFSISLKTGKLDEVVLRAIDKAIPFPLIFELTWRGQRKAVAAFKRQSEADSTKWVVSEYFATNWVPEETARMPLPVALDLGALYDRLLTAIMSPEMSAPGQGDDDIQARVDRMEAIRAKTREVERIKIRLAREKQYNKRVAINAELRKANQELAELQYSGVRRAGSRLTSTNI